MSAKLYIDNTEIGEFTDSNGSVHSFNGCVPPSIKAGTHTATAKIRYPGYPDEITVSGLVTVFGEVATSNVIDFEELSEASYTNASAANTAIGWFKEITSNINSRATINIDKEDETHGKVYTIKLLSGVNDILAGQSYAHIYARQNADKTFVTTTRSGKVVFEFDIKLRGFWGASVTFAPFSAGGSSHTSYTLVTNNKITGTDVSLKSGYNWYHVQVVVDLDNMKMYGKFGDTVMPSKDFAWNASNASQNYLTYFRLGARAYGTVDGETDYYSLDNIRTSYIAPVDTGYNGICITEPEISVSNGTAIASFDAEAKNAKTVTAITAVYNGNKLEKAEIEEVNILKGSGNYTTTPVALPQNYTEIKCFVWQSVDSVIPIGKF